MTSQAQSAARGLLLAYQAPGVLSPDKHSQQPLACHCPKRHASSSDLTSTPSSHWLPSGLQEKEAAVTSQAQAAAIGLPLPDEALTLLSTQKHSKQSGACHCPQGHGGCCDLRSPASSYGPATGL